MTNQQILERAIKKAIERGWAFDFIEVISNPGGLIVMDNVGVKYTINDVIFNHNFAKALWGEEQAINGVPILALGKLMAKVAEAQGGRLTNSEVSTLLSIKSEPRYRYFLQQMVIAEDPIKYLGENI